MRQDFKRSIALLLTVLMVFSLLMGCGGSKDDAEDKGEDVVSEKDGEADDSDDEEIHDGPPTVIKFGHHNVPEIDPTYRDPITDEPGMPADELLAGEKAMEKVLDELNVEVEWVQYPADIQEILLQSVLADDPIVDIACCWNGSQLSVLGQNIAQELSDYEEIFTEDPDATWMFADEMFDGHYLLNYLQRHITVYPLVFNIDYIEAVDALKEDGKTIYPTDLWRDGEWTWSRFEEYLIAVDEYYSDKMAPVRTDVPIKAFQTDYRPTVNQAIYANGGAVSRSGEFEADSKEAKEAVAYLEDLYSRGLMMSVNYEGTHTPGWTWQDNDFGNGETVFTNLTTWGGPGVAENLASREQSMGIVPFPRPDHMDPDDPRYEQVGEPVDQAIVLKGLSEERTELAVKTHKIYWQTYYQELSGEGTSANYKEVTAEQAALDYGLDIFHEEIGDDILEAFKEYLVPINLVATPWRGYWDGEIMGKAMCRMDGSPEYAIAVEEKKGELMKYEEELREALGSDEFVDNMPPHIDLIEPPLAFAKGTDPSSIDWNEWIEVEDAVDGMIEVTDEDIELSEETDFNEVGYGKVKVTVADEAGNEASGEYDIIIFDPDNTTPPTIEAKEEYRTLAIDEDVSEINWGDDFIEVAVDADEFDIKPRIEGDLSELDTTTAGTYDVEITVTDFAGNEASVTIPITVEAEE